MAIVEVNNRFVDGVQVATGCTLGNNSLIYADIGKNVLTVFRRGGRGIRVYIDSEELREKYFSREVLEKLIFSSKLHLRRLRRFFLHSCRPLLLTTLSILMQHNV